MGAPQISFSLTLFDPIITVLLLRPLGVFPLIHHIVNIVHLVLHLAFVLGPLQLTQSLHGGEPPILVYSLPLDARTSWEQIIQLSILFIDDI